MLQMGACWSTWCVLVHCMRPYALVCSRQAFLAGAPAPQVMKRLRWRSFGAHQVLQRPHRPHSRHAHGTHSGMHSGMHQAADSNEEIT